MSAINQKNEVHDFLAGGGELGALIAAHDWESTPLGPIRTWRQSLKTTVAILLRSEVPMVLLWGASGVMIYNDAYAVVAAGRHPMLLGANVREGWPEVAAFNDHVMQVCLGGDTLVFRDQELTLLRSGRPEQVWMNLDYSPVLDEEGVPAGVIAIVVETTEKVAAERWRISERDRQRQMFEQAPGFMAMVTGPEHVFELTNAAYRQLVGHRDVLGLSVRTAFPEIEDQGFIDLLDQVYSSGERFVGTAIPARLQRRPEGPMEERLVDLVYQPIRNPTGNVIGIFIQGADVTERHRAEEALRQSEEQFRTFAESMPNQIWTSGPDGMLTWFSPQVYAYSGAAVGELDGAGWATIVHPNDIAEAAEGWSAAIKLGKLYETEFRLRRHDGVYHWHIARAVPIRNAEGAILRWIGTNTDIHDQKLTARKLEESERRLTLSQKAAGIGSLELDIASGTVYGSEDFWQIWGLPAGESVHISTLEAIVLLEDKDIRSTPETRVKGTARPNVEYRIRRPDTGELRWLSRSIDFVHDEQGKPIKMFGVMQDITARKDFEERQKMLAHELEHRIKNILTMVSAIATQTLRNTDIETGRATLNERLRALSKAHDILTDTRWTAASLHEVLIKTVAVFPTQQIQISGPQVALNPRMALSLALAANELGTNALKYGALSVPQGQVLIEWSTPVQEDGSQSLVWRWRETGGPAVSPPTRKGFGSVLVKNVLAADFAGTVQLDYHRDGLECLLIAPMAEGNPLGHLG
jgi:PAS domain S-box-containing protein